MTPGAWVCLAGAVILGAVGAPSHAWRHYHRRLYVGGCWLGCVLVGGGAAWWLS